MFLTPLFEVRLPAKDQFLSLSLDKNNGITVYKYIDGNGVNKVTLSQDAFKQLTLATLPDGTVVKMGLDGKIFTIPLPQGI